MNENYPIQETGPISTQLPESIGPDVIEQSDIPHELRQQQQMLQQADNQNAPDNQEEAQDNEEFKPTPQRTLKKNEYTNAANLRRQLEQAQRERDEALRKLKYGSESQLGDDDLAEGKHIKRVQDKVAELEAQLIQARIKAQYSDFDTVVTAHNLALLRDSYPELALTLQAAPDLYTQASSAYTLIKKFGIAPDAQEVANKARVQQNYAKPRPASAAGAQQGESPLTRANAFAEGLSEDLKKQLFKEMNQARQGY